MEQPKRGRKIVGESKRVPISFTVEEHLIKEFKAYCRDNGISGSSYIQRCIVDFLKKNKNN